MMQPPEARPVMGWSEPAALYDALVGDDSLGFSWDVGDGFLSYLGVGEQMSTAFPPVPPPDEATTWEGPGQFGGGWIGWVEFENRAPESRGLAPGAWLRVDRFVALDPATKRIWAIAPGKGIERWAARVENAVIASTATSPSRGGMTSPLGNARARNLPEEYADLIESAREEIRRGDAYQLCLTTRFTVPGHHDPRAVHERMRSSAAPYCAMIRAGDTSLVAASPEAFLHVDSSGRVRTSPIKGTRPRSSDKVEDARLAGELAADPKERAENLMIVDLMRNDLSRVCEAQSIRVERLFQVETHTHVHQLVSEISGRLAPGNGVRELIASCFPAGSMTGAPKHSAMRILARLENAPRGVYSGCFGWIGDDGAARLAMAIRCAVITPDEAYVGAGGGLTIDSETRFEVAEVALKAAAPLRALGACVPDEWRRFTLDSSADPAMM